MSRSIKNFSLLLSFPSPPQQLIYLRIIFSSFSCPSPISFASEVSHIPSSTLLSLRSNVLRISWTFWAEAAEEQQHQRSRKKRDLIFGVKFTLVRCRLNPRRPRVLQLLRKKKEGETGFSSFFPQSLNCLGVSIGVKKRTELTKED